MVPKYTCCLWQGEQAVGCETVRFERRPTQDCVAYQAPAVAGVYGDPHIVTFDDLEVGSSIATGLLVANYR